MPIQIWNRQYKFNKSATATSCRLPIKLQIRNRQVQRIGNRQLVASCRFIELILSVSNLNRQLATSCRLPIRWTCLFRIGNYIGNRQLVPVVDSLNFYCLFWIWIGNRQLVAVLLIRWTCLFRIGNWIGNRQPVASYRFVELIFSVSNLNREPALVADSLKLSVSNRQLAIRFRFVELILSVSNGQLNRPPATESATVFLGPYIVSFESATESATGSWIGNRPPANFLFWFDNRQPAANFSFPKICLFFTYHSIYLG